jgi:hypothetical protein
LLLDVDEDKRLLSADGEGDADEENKREMVEPVLPLLLLPRLRLPVLVGDDEDDDDKVKRDLPGDRDDSVDFELFSLRGDDPGEEEEEKRDDIF